MQDLDVERVAGDLRDPESLDAAVQGCGAVFHVAADYRLWARDTRECTARMSKAHEMSLARRGKPAWSGLCTPAQWAVSASLLPESVTKRRRFAIEDMQGAYKRSKFLAEQTALEFARSGFEVVIVNPTAPVGDHDFKPTPTGKMVVDFLRGGMPAFLDTGLNVVDADDVAEGHLLALERGRAGERYILGRQNMTLREIFQHLAIYSRSPGSPRLGYLMGSLSRPAWPAPAGLI